MLALAVGIGIGLAALGFFLGLGIESGLKSLADAIRKK
jgi:hypothetical protein